MFRMGSQIASLATTELADPLNRVLFPGYSRVAADSGALKRAYLQSFSLLTYLGIPAAVGIAACSEPLVLTLLGEKWVDAIPVVEIMALHGSLHLLSINDYAIYMALGRPKMVLLLYFPYVVALVTFILFFTPDFGIVGGAIAFIAADCLLIPVFFFVRFRTLSLTLKEFSDVIWRTIAASMFMFLGVRLFIDWSEGAIASEFLLLLASVGVGICSFLLVSYGSWLMARPRFSAEATIYGFLHIGYERFMRAQAG